VKGHPVADPPILFDDSDAPWKTDPPDPGTRRRRHRWPVVLVGTTLVLGVGGLGALVILTGNHAPVTIVTPTQTVTTRVEVTLTPTPPTAPTVPPPSASPSPRTTSTPSTPPTTMPVTPVPATHPVTTSPATRPPVTTTTPPVTIAPPATTRATPPPVTKPPATTKAPVTTKPVVPTKPPVGSAPVVSSLSCDLAGGAVTSVAVFSMGGLPGTVAFSVTLGGVVAGPPQSIPVPANGLSATALWQGLPDTGYLCTVTVTTDAGTASTSARSS